MKPLSTNAFATLRRKTLSILWIALGLQALAGCAAQPGEEMTDEVLQDEEDAVAAHAAFLQNNNAFVNCGAQQQARIQRAVNIVATRIYEFGGSSFRACMADAFMGDFTSPNGVWAQYNREGVTTFRCTNSLEAECGSIYEWWGCASQRDSGEYMRLSNTVLNDPNVSDATLAGVIAHELAHNYGYGHLATPWSTDYNATVTQRAWECAANNNQQPRNQSRTNGMTGERELAAFGGFGGSPTHLACKPGRFMNGLQIRRGSEIDAVAARCNDSAAFSVFRGGTGGSLAPVADTTCPTNTVLVGITGRSGGRVDQLRPVCAPISNTSARTFLAAQGGSGGTQFESFCPAGTAVTRLQFRSGGKIDQVQLVCNTASNTLPSAAPMLTVDGGQFDRQNRLRCSGDGALQGFFGRSGGRVDRLSGICNTTERSAGNLVLRSVEHVMTPIVGGGGGSEFANNCASDELMVGMRLRAGGRIDAIGPICAKANNWARGTTTVTRSLALNGGTGGSLVTRMCPARQFLVGLDAFAGGEVTGLRGVCRKLL